MRNPRKGDRVRIWRDENLYPSKGTWPRFRNKTGRVVSVNRDSGLYDYDKTTKPWAKVYRRRPDCAHNEYGVSFARTGHSVDAWFRPYEVTVMVQEDRQQPR